MTTRISTSDTFYVYVLLDPRKSYEPFYVGKGSKRRIWRTLDPCRNKFKASVLSKIKETGEKPGILKWADNLSEDAAFDLERALIARFGRRCDGTGILTNLTAGGEGLSNPSPETLRKMRERMRGAGSPTYGGHTEEAKAKMRASQKAYFEKNGSRAHTQEHRQRMREYNPGGKATAKPLYQIGLDGIVIREWPSSKAAGEALGIRYCNIANRARDGERLTAAQSWWRWVGSPEVAEGRLITAEELRTSNKAAKDAGTRPIIQIDCDGLVIRRWASFQEAATYIGVKYSTLWQACKNGRICGGFRWMRPE